MATILEFDELPEGSQVTFATQSGGPIIAKAVEAPVIPPPPDPPTPSEVGGVVSFLTVARVSAKRLLDAPFAMVASWTDGQPIYTRSFGGARWHWQADYPASSPTDNETTCRPSSWAGIDGAAVRSLEGNQTAHRQTAWKVDVTAPDNEGAGGDADPLKNDAEIQRRWGIGKRGRLAQATTITWAQSPASLTSLLFELAAGGSLRLVGTPTISKAGTLLTAVQLQNRATPTPWAITAVGLGAAEVGKLIVITASSVPANVGAYAMGLKDEGAGKLRVSPFGTYSETLATFAMVTPAVGDTIEVRDTTATTLSVGKIEGHATTCEAGSSAVAQRLTIDSLHLDSLPAASVSVASLLCYGAAFYYVRSTGKLLRLAGIPTNVATQHFWRGGGFVAGGLLIIPTGTVSVSQVGMLSNANPRANGSLLLSSDCYFQNASLSGQASCAITSSGCAFFDRSSPDQTVGSSVGCFFQQSGAVPDWGTNNAGHGVAILAGGNYIYTTKPTVNLGLGAGREAKIGGTDKLYAAVPFIEPANNAAIVLSA